MSDKVKITVVANNPSAPGGRRCRGTFRFGPTPQTVEVTPEQLKEIERDPILKVIPTPEVKPAVGVTKVLTEGMLAEDAIKKINNTSTEDELKLISTKGDDRVTVKEAYIAKKKALKEAQG